jgi:hypothetical protein
MNEVTKLMAKIRTLQDQAQVLHKMLAAQLVLRELLHISADADVVVSGKWVLVQAEAQFEVTVSPTEPDTRGGPCFGTEVHVFQYEAIPQALGGGLVERTYDGDEPEHKQTWASLCR